MQKNILLLDDNPSTLKAYEESIRHNCLGAGVRLFTFLTETDFLAAFFNIGKENIDLIVCDQHLGVNKTSGYDIIAALQRDGYRGHAAVLTSDDTAEMEVRMYLTDGVHYIKKNSPGGGAFTELCSLVKRVIAGEKNDFWE